MNAVRASSPRKALVLCLFAAAAAFLLLETSYAQERPEYDYVDLLMVYEQGPSGDQNSVAYSVQNIGTATATGVTVLFVLEDLQADSSDLEPSSITDMKTVDSTNQRFTWEIGTIPPGGASGTLTFSTGLHPGRYSEVVSGWLGRIGDINATASS